MYQCLHVFVSQSISISSVPSLHQLLSYYLSVTYYHSHSVSLKLSRHHPTFLSVSLPKLLCLYLNCELTFLSIYYHLISFTPHQYVILYHAFLPQLYCASSQYRMIGVYSFLGSGRTQRRHRIYIYFFIYFQ